MNGQDEAAVRAVVEAVVRRVTGTLTLDQARRLSEQIRAEAARCGVKAVVAVADRAGHPILVECMDDAYIASYDIAVNKAYTVAALKLSTAALKPLAQPGGSLYGIQHTNGGKIVVFGGGEPLMNGDALVGGLGVSGGTEEQDTALAAYGKRIFEASGGMR